MTKAQKIKAIIGTAIAAIIFILLLMAIILIAVRMNQKGKNKDFTIHPSF